jgi:N-acetylglucosamine-6-sulfatase
LIAGAVLAVLAATTVTVVVVADSLEEDHPASTPTAGEESPTPGATTTDTATTTITPTAAPEQSGKPNVFVIVMDDMRWDDLRHMPEFRARVADQGVTFSNAFVTTSLCCPSRASFLSGRYAHNHGVWDNTPPDGGFEAFDDADTLATRLDSEYRTALIGKYMNGYDGTIARGESYIPPGWNDWYGISEGYFNYLFNDGGALGTRGQNPEDYSTDVLKDRAATFLTDAVAGDEPFFLWLSFYAPHAPVRPGPPNLECREIEAYRPPSFNEADVSDKPIAIRRLPLLSNDDQEDVDRKNDGRACTLRAADMALRELLDLLETADELDDTLIIFTSDNGLAVGEHRRESMKVCVYEECIRVPLVISYPPLISAEARGESDSLALNIDIAPTIYEITGVSPPPDMDGVSLLSVLAGETESLRERFLLEHLTIDEFNYAVRTTTHLYAVHENGEIELYDLTDDPYQLTNLAYRPAVRATRCALAGELDALLPEGVGPPTADEDCDGQADSYEDECGSAQDDTGDISADNERDGTPDCVDFDDDNDGLTDTDERACGSDPSSGEDSAPDTDGDGEPDCRDDNDDGNTHPDSEDNCPLLPNRTQPDADGDGAGDDCDTT